MLMSLLIHAKKRLRSKNVKEVSTAGVMSFLVEDGGKRWDLRYFTSKGLIDRMFSPLVYFTFEWRPCWKKLALHDIL